MDSNDCTRHRIDLAKPLILIQGAGWVLGCGYLNADTFSKTGESCAIVTGVATHDEMLAARVIDVSEPARLAGVKIGDLGAMAIDKMKISSE